MLEFEGAPNEVRDCIVRSVRASKPGTTVEHTDVYGTAPFVDQAQSGKGCFSAPPMFVNPQAFDYRLVPNSPCRGKASDGGDVGCRYTPEMIEILEVALKLRAAGLIEF
jgi:hypothetical protein